MGESTRYHAASWRKRALPLAVPLLVLACGPTSHKSEPVEATQTSGAGGLGAGGGSAAQGGNSTSGGNGGTAGRTSSNGSFSPPCDPADNTLAISTGDVLTDLPSTMTFSVFDPPTSKQFTGNGSNGDVRVYLPEPAGMDRIFPTATVVDPLDRESANIELVLASGVLNARYIVATGAKLYAQVTATRVALTLCDMEFYPASDPPGLPDISVSGRIVAITR